MIETKLRRGTFQHVEQELYAYHDTKKEIIRLRNDIIYATPEPDEINIVKGKNSVRQPGDPTGRAAVAIAMYRKIEHLEKIVAAIESVLGELSEEKKKMVSLRYWTKPRILTWDGIAREIPAHRATVLRWRNEIVYAIAERLGWR